MEEGYATVSRCKGFGTERGTKNGVLGLGRYVFGVMQVGYCLTGPREWFDEGRYVRSRSTIRARETVIASYRHISGPGVNPTRLRVGRQDDGGWVSQSSGPSPFGC